MELAQDKIKLFPKEMPRWMRIANVLIVLLLLVVVGISPVVLIFFASPFHSWWNIFDYSQRHGYVGQLNAATNISSIIFLYALVIFIAVGILGLIYAIRGKLDWNTYLIWIYIHIGFLVFAFLADLAILMIHP